jgi:hypothetical protein
MRALERLAGGANPAARSGLVGEKERDAKTPHSDQNYAAETAARSRVLTVEGLRM